MKRHLLYLMAISMVLFACTVTGTLFDDNVEPPPPDEDEMTMTTKSSSVSFGIAGTGSITIDWGDEKKETLTLSDNTTLSHNYLNANTHKITITGGNIVRFYCNNSQLTTLDVVKKTMLISLDCSNNQIETLDVSNNIALTELFCNKNQLTVLNISTNIALGSLNCSENKLTALDANKNVELIWLNCSDNNLGVSALDALFGTLHNKPGEKTIHIADNPGTNTCTVSIAEGKGWTVLK